MAGGHASSGDGRTGVMSDDVHISRDRGLTFEALAPLPMGPDNYGHMLFVDEKTLFYQPGNWKSKPFYFLDLGWDSMARR